MCIPRHGGFLRRLSRRALSAALLSATLTAPRLFAGSIGTNHPVSGAYSPVNPSTWGTSSWPLGAAFTAGPGSTLNVAVYSAHATNVVLEIYLSDTGADATYDYTMTKGSDNIWRAAIAQVPNRTLYAFRAWGPNWPFSSSWARGNSSAGFQTDCDTAGNRFNPNKVLFDPYAREISHNTATPAMLAAGESPTMYKTGGTNVSSGLTYTGPITGNVPIDRRNVDTGKWAPKAVVLVDTTSTGPKPNLNQKDAVIYETHLKGLTAHPSSVNLRTLLSSYSGFADAANVPDGLRGTYAGAAYMAGYLKDLGINTVEFLPVHETNNATSSTTAAGSNYWAYWTYGFFAPDRRYSSNQSLGGPTAEFKAMVAAFHNAGLEVYLDVVYNHTAEGGVDSTHASGETVFFRGLDNSAYYTLTGTNNDGYANVSGTGNDLNGGSAPVQQMVLDSLQYWNQTMGIDGFRFDLAVELGRNGNGGFSSTSPLLTSIARLASTNGFKIVAEPWDTQDGNEIGHFPAGWACWNGNYRDAVRSYVIGSLAGKNGTGYADAIYGSYNQMNGEGGPQKSVNLLDAHDGFTLVDLVSYNSQTQTGLTWPFGPGDGGTNDNRSSNWGGNNTERRQLIRSFWTLQVLSRGVPMLEWGDEFGRTVNGNNNAYNLDSVATWNNYNMIPSNAPDSVATGDTGARYANNLSTFNNTRNGNFVFLQYLLQLRAAHVALRQSNYSMSISFARSDGSSFNEWSDLATRVRLSGSQVGDHDFLLLSNMTGSLINFTLPSAPSGTHWVRLVDTNSWAENVSNCWTEAAASTFSTTYGVNGQSVVVMEAIP